MSWRLISGTNGHYEYNAELDKVRNSRTKKELKPRYNNNGLLCYRFRFEGMERLFSVNTVKNDTGIEGKPHVKICEVCGKEFKPLSARSKYCSKKCKAKHDTQTYQPWLRKRCKKYGVPFEKGITREAVIEKFNGTCCMCGKKVNREGNIKDWPTIDHIVPLSYGGAHEWENVQLLCLSCNSKKGLKVSDEEYDAFIDRLLHANC